MISSKGQKEYRIYTETEGYGTTYSPYYTKTEAIKTARGLAKEYPESYFEVYHEYSERVVWKRGKKSNPGKKIDKNKWIRVKSIKLRRDGGVDIKR